MSIDSVAKEENEVSTFFEYRIIRSDGLLRALKASSVRANCEDQRFTMAFIRDITEMKGAREKIRRRENELGTMTI
jgi:PAS domain S-box-containing protein